MSSGRRITLLLCAHGSMLTVLTSRVDIATSRDKAWPRTPRGMASALARIAPALTEHGVRAERLSRTHGKRGWRLVRFKREEAPS